jgi:glutamyl-tRNA reductase
MSLYTLGLNHTTAPLDVRARVAFAPDALSGALRDLTSSREVKEAAILSTCNRTEVYFHGGEPEGVARWLEKTHTLTPATLSPYVYTLNERLHQFDVVVTCTASTLPIIGKGMLERVVKQRRHAPVLIVDLGVPRDVEAEAAELDDVFLYSVDDLSDIVKDNLQIRRDAVVQAERMIADQASHFLRWLQGRSVVPTIANVSSHHEALRKREVERAQRMLANGTAPADVVEALSRSLTNKFLHPSLAALNAAGEAERAELIALFSRIYGCAEPPADS